MNTESNHAETELYPPKERSVNSLLGAPESPYPKEGDDFAQYTQLHVIGKGASACVFKAFDPALNRWVALKILHSGFSLSEENRLRFTREIKIMANLSIYGITAIFEQGEHGGHYYFTMEYVDGLTLDRHLEAHTCSLKERLELMADLAKILAELHHHKIYHRDIKPQNIMVDKNGKIRLMDLGIAKAEEKILDVDVTQPGALICTPAYMAPEQVDPLMDDSDLSKLDVYALGLIVYESLTKQAAYLFEGKKTLIKLHNCILNSTFTPPHQLDPMISTEVSGITLKLLSS